MTGTAKSYVALISGQFQETRGDLEGARASYRRAVRDLADAGQYVAAAAVLEALGRISLLTGSGYAADLTFARQQKLGGQENGIIAFLQAEQGNAAGASHSLQLAAQAHPEFGAKGVEMLENYQALYLALSHQDAPAVLAAASRLPNSVSARVLFPRGWAYFATKDYVRAEADLRETILDERRLSDFNIVASHSPLVLALAHFYLGQVYDATGRREQAANEYQEFLSHFEDSECQLPQIALAKAALQHALP